MRKIFWRGFCMTVALLLFTVPALAAEVTLYHTNDIHARVEAGDDYGKSVGIAELAAVVKDGKQHKSALWLDAGDLLHGMPRINMTKGEAMAELMNSAGLDAMTPGNHDFNYGFDQLKHLSKEFKFPVLSANVVMKDTPAGQAERVFAFRPYKIFKLDNGVKVGVFGLTTPEVAFKTNPKNITDIEIIDPIKAAEAMVSMLRPQCDVVVAVMHMGVDLGSEIKSETIAKSVTGIDVIIDGHSHTTLPEGEMVDGVLIVQTGWHGYCLGEVTLDVENHKVVGKTARLIQPEEMKKIAPEPDKEVMTTLHKLHKDSDKIMNEVVTHSDRELTAERNIVRAKEAELGNFYADAFRATAKTDIAVINGGCLRAPLPAGNVTRGDLMGVTPFGNTLKAIRVKGSVVRAIIEHSVSQVPGNFGGFLDFSGLTFSFDPSSAPGARVREVLVGGQALDDNKDYTLAAVDYFCDGGDDYSMVIGAPVIGEFDTVEAVIAAYINSGVEVKADMGRIKVLEPAASADSEGENTVELEEAA